MSIDLGFAIICHSNPQAVIELVDILLDFPRSHVIVHVDKSSDKSVYQYITEHAVDYGSRFHVIEDRRNCDWASFTLVEVTLDLLREFRSRFPDVTQIQLMSGSDIVLADMHNLTEHFTTHGAASCLDVHKPLERTWVRHGANEERYQFYHIVKWRDSQRGYRYQEKVQKFFGVKRQLPLGMEPLFGSQWINFHSEHVDVMFDLISSEPSVDRFFRKVMVPDEIYFHSILSFLKKKLGIRILPGLVHCDFYPNGAAVTYYDSHALSLLKTGRFFARKASDNAKLLRMLPRLDIEQLPDDISVLNGVRQYESIQIADKFSPDLIGAPFRI